jgi:hypothetical protein
VAIVWRIGDARPAQEETAQAGRLAHVESEGATRNGQPCSSLPNKG